MVPEDTRSIICQWLLKVLEKCHYFLPTPFAITHGFVWKKRIYPPNPAESIGCSPFSFLKWCKMGVDGGCVPYEIRHIAKSQLRLKEHLEEMLMKSRLPQAWGTEQKKWGPTRCNNISGDDKFGTWTKQGLVVVGISPNYWGPLRIYSPRLHPFASFGILWIQWCSKTPAAEWQSPRHRPKAAACCP